MTLYAIAIHHPSHPPGQWHLAGTLYDSPQAAEQKARHDWAGGEVAWEIVALQTVPAPEDGRQAIYQRLLGVDPPV